VEPGCEQSAIHRLDSTCLPVPLERPHDCSAEAKAKPTLDGRRATRDADADADAHAAPARPRVGASRPSANAERRGDGHRRLWLDEQLDRKQQAVEGEQERVEHQADG
jgi:hypothetical protein